jgi:hypothetical protein
MADPARTGRDESIQSVKAAFAEGKPVDEKLGVLLAEAVRGNGGGPLIGRILDLLDEIDCLQRILLVKPELLNHPNALIRSRAILLVGRASKNYSWLKKQLFDRDPRVQANAVEAIWGVDNRDAREILEMGENAQNNRVVANALYGYYKIGDTASVGKLFAMARNPDEVHRASAYWAMGETLDPRFLPCITDAYRKDGPKVKGIALRALTQLRRQLKSFEEPGELKVIVRREEVRDEGWRAADFSLLAQRQGEPVTLGPTNLVLSANDSMVEEWESSHDDDPDLLAVAFAHPRIIMRDDPYLVSILNGMSACLEFKRARDLWTLDRFVPWRDEPEGAKDDMAWFGDPPNDPLLLKHLRENRGFLVEPQFISKVLPGPGHREKAARNLAACVERSVDALQRVAGSRHLFLFLEAVQIPLEVIEYLVLECRNHNIALHGFAPRAAEFWPFVRELSFETGGGFHFVEDDHLQEQIFREYAAIFNRHSVRYRIPGDSNAAEVDLTIYSPSGVAHAKLTGGQDEQSQSGETLPSTT